MPTCGYCKESGQSIEHVRQCSSAHYTKLAEPIEIAPVAQTYAQASDYRPMALAEAHDAVPESKYALVLKDSIQFFEVDYGRKGSQWEGRVFVSELFGAPGGWRHQNLYGAARQKVLATIALDPKGAALLFSKEHGVCAACGSPLSDADSRARGLGPVCAARFA